MIEPRLASGMLVGALLRRVQAAGGNATVLARGDPGAGAIVVVTCERGADPRAWERGYDVDGRAALVPTGPAPDPAADPATGPTALDDYLARRRARDRDLWVIELDVADAKRFAAETIGSD